MSNYLPLVKKTFEFQGDKISAEFKRLTRAQMIKIAPHIPSEDADETLMDQMKTADVSIGILIENMESFKGLKDEDGNALEFNDICHESYFTPLLSEMAMSLLSESMVSDEKKSSSSSDPSSKSLKDLPIIDPLSVEA